jgi:hypothetical protein
MIAGRGFFFKNTGRGVVLKCNKLHQCTIVVRSSNLPNFGNFLNKSSDMASHVETLKSKSFMASLVALGRVREGDDIDRSDKIKEG